MMVNEMQELLKRIVNRWMQEAEERSLWQRLKETFVQQYISDWILKVLRKSSRYSY